MVNATDALKDAAEREHALAPDVSFIVRAPAGSGKTELLTRRFLRLLAMVDEPEEIIAITFTRAATAEMRNRVFRDLEKASLMKDQPTEDQALLLARAALARSEARGWNLLEQPHRLNIETIDSLCLRIAHNQPLLSRMGGKLSPLEHAEPLYAEAARRTFGRLGSANSELNAALAHLLELRDNNLSECEDLLATMLARRDQWVRAFPLTGDMSEDDWAQARSRLEHPFREEVKRVHGEAHRLLSAEPTLVGELFELAHYACGNGNADITILDGAHSLPTPESAAMEHWHAICSFLLTKDGNWRKRLTQSEGFPATTSAQKKMKTRMGSLLTRLQQLPGLERALHQIRELPEPYYDEWQWTTLRHIFAVLRQGVAELRVLFAERNNVDFVELNLAAQDVLRNSDASADAMLATSGNIRHILVDEFQDTSRSQHDLLCLLVRAWEANDRRTCFLVGDPMQSVYLFRQAEVELFDHVTRNGLISREHTVDLHELELVTNFRSHEGLTTRWNNMFNAVFAPNGNTNSVPQVNYSRTFAAQRAMPGEAVHIHAQFAGTNPEDKEAALKSEAEQVLEIIEQHRECANHAEAAGEEYRVAVLARSRLHLARIASLLRQRRVPFRAVDLETLDERQELIDLMSLTRALLHPMDRVAWLSILRAPWCGLTMGDLHVLTGADDSTLRYLPVLELVEKRMPYLSADGAARLKRVTAILQQALAVRFDGLHATSFSQWIERTWRSLGGPRCLDTDAYGNAQAFFSMLDMITPDGMVCLAEDFEAEMKRLYAKPDPRVSERAGVQLMTIHKAKGLGFDVVIVPGLDRAAASDDPPLICSLERTNAGGETEMLVAPIGSREDDQHPTYKWVRRQIQARADEELKRLLYVACTRARQSLHLLGTATITDSGLKPGDSRSLLATAWPALKPEFERAFANQNQQAANVIVFPAPTSALVNQSTTLDIAASADDRPSALRLRRLPVDDKFDRGLPNVTFAAPNFDAIEPPLERPHGSRDARQKGTVVHALFQHLSNGAPTESLPNAARALLRSAAYSGKILDETTAEVINAVRNCMADPDGSWILSVHPQARSEASWTELSNGALETIRADRVFVAGAEPRATGEDHLWIIDYKMIAPAGDADFLLNQRKAYAPQLARYARVLREAEGITLPVRFGLYYPRIARLDWWSAVES